MPLTIQLDLVFKATCLAALITFSAPALAADPPIRVGGTTWVTPAAPAYAEDSRVAMDAQGNYVVAWHSGTGPMPGLYGQRFNSAGVAQGAVFGIADTTVQADLSMAMNASGQFVVAWKDVGGSSIKARRFGANGTAVGSTITFSDGSTWQGLPDVGIDAQGNFTLAWVRGGAPRAVRYNSDGVAISGHFAIDFPVIGVGPANHLWVASTPTLNGQSAVYVQLHDGSGQKVGARIKVANLVAGYGNDWDGASHRSTDLAVGANGDFVITWWDAGSQWVRRYTVNGTAQTEALLVNPASDLNLVREDSSVAMDANGDFAVTWHRDEYVQGGSANEGIYLQRFGQDGTRELGPLQINSITTYHRDNARVAADADGDLVVAWNERFFDAATGGFASRVMTQRLRNAEPIDVSLTQFDAPSLVSAGSSYSYTVNVSNLRPQTTLTGIASIDQAIGASQNLRFSYTASPNFLAGIVGTDWLCTRPSGSGLFRLPGVCTYQKSLLAGQSAPPLKINTTAQSGVSSQSNDARLVLSQIDPNELNNREVESTPILATNP